MRTFLRKLALRIPAIASLSHHAAKLQADLDAAAAENTKLAAELNNAIIERDQSNHAKNEIVGTIFGPQISREYLIYNYWIAHPRCRFFKTLPPNAKLLDIGAGSGGTAVWREWGNPHRHDIKLYGFDLEPSESNHPWDTSYAHLYEKWQYGNLENTPLDFQEGFFDAAMASNVLEHVSQPFSILRELFGKLKPGARVYIEIPTFASKALPTAPDLTAQGMPVMVGNFYDDCTHIETYSLSTISDVARSIGFIIDEGGAARHPFLEETMVHYGLEHNDTELLLYGYWSLTGWIQYIILRRPYDPATITGSLREKIGDKSFGEDLWI